MGEYMGMSQDIVSVLDEFCASRDNVHALPEELLLGILREQLRNLTVTNWTKPLDNGANVLRTLNLSCVMLLSAIPNNVAYRLLLNLGVDESEALPWCSLIVKCLRKLNKSLGTPSHTQRPELDVQRVLNVLRCWLQKVLPRTSAHGAAFSTGETAAKILLEGCSEIVEAAKTAAPSAAADWIERLSGEEARSLGIQRRNSTEQVLERRASAISVADDEAWLQEEAGEKENPTTKSRVRTPPRRLSSPAKMSQPSVKPCGVRNALISHA